MKKVKFITCFFIMLFCLILNCELYQTYLKEYTSNFSYLEVGYFLDDNREVDLIDLVKEKADENDLSVFSVKRDTLSAFSNEMKIYCDENIQKTLSEKYQISSGEFSALFSGKTSVEYIPFEELEINQSGEAGSKRIYFIGDNEKIETVRGLLKNDYGVSRVKKEDKSINLILIICAWIVFGVFFLLLTKLDIQFQKKENFILISLGRDQYKIILKNILYDTLAISVMFFAIKLLLSRFAYTDYQFKATFMLLVATLLINSFVCLSMLKIDYKEVLYGANITDNLLSDCYMIKAFSMILAVSVLSVNLLLVNENANIVSQYKNIDKYYDYQFINVSFEVCEDDSGIAPETLYTDMFVHLYKNTDVGFSHTVLSNGDDFGMIVTDKKTAVEIWGFSEDEVESITDDFRVYYPENDENKKDFAEEYQFIENCFPLLRKINGEVTSYNDKHKGVVFDIDSTLKKNGFDVVSNPVICICNFSEDIIGIEKGGSISTDFGNIMFRLSENDIEYLKETYENENVKLNFMTVPEKCNEYKMVITRTLLLSLVISIFIMMLEFAIISTIIKLEYTINATESAIKKVLGYSIYKRNKKIFMLNLFAALIGIMTVIVATFMASVSKIISSTQLYVIVLVGVAILFLELPIIVSYINKTEKANVAKILKGGSL